MLGYQETHKSIVKKARKWKDDKRKKSVKQNITLIYGYEYVIMKENFFGIIFLI